MPRPEPTPAAKGAGWAGAAAVAFVFAVVLLPPLALAAAVWWPLRRRLRQVEWAVVLAVGVAALVLSRGQFGDYFTWLFALVSDGGAPLPWAPLLAGATATAGALGVLTTWERWNMLEPLRRRKGDAGRVMPDDDDRRRIDLAPVPQQAMPTAGDHDLDEADRGLPGRRLVPLGVDRHGEVTGVTEDELKEHMMILGSTGTGKTETVKTLLAGLLDLGWPGTILDLKEDREKGGLQDFCRQYTATQGMPYQEVAVSDPNSPYWFNPLKGLSPDEARDAIMAMQEFEAPYYKALNERMLGQLVRLFYEAHQVDPDTFPAPDVYRIGHTLTQNLRDATKDMVKAVMSNLPSRTGEDFQAVTHPDPAARDAAPGLGARLTAAYETDAGRYVLRPRSAEHPVLDVTAGGLSYIGSNSLGQPEISHMVATATMLRLAAYAGQRTTGEGRQSLTDVMAAMERGDHAAVGAAKEAPRRFLAIDESAFVDRRILLNILQRARSAGIATIVITQSPKDWDNAADPNLGWPSLTQNTNCAIIMRQRNNEAAEICADYLGTHEVEDRRMMVQEGEVQEGTGSVSTRTQHIVSPEELRGLERGEGIISVGSSHKLGWSKFAMRDPTADLPTHRQPPRRRGLR